MQEEQLKIVLSLLGGVIFAMVFILIALVVPVKKETSYQPQERPKGMLEKVSKAAKERVD